MKLRKSRLLTGLLCLALAVTSVFGVFLSNGKTVGRAEAATSRLRFKQIAAGADFAIGLTYNNDLYGWSLLSTRENVTRPTPSAATLGGYYTGTPKKIELNFVLGPSCNGYTIAQGTQNFYNAGNSAYWTSTTDTIKYIAATPTTAAFVTEKGFLYTWGKDPTVSGEVSDNNASLLLRTTNDSHAWYTPDIINYTFYGRGLFGSNDGFFKEGNGIEPLSLYAGEHNYYLNYRATSAQHSSSLVWGASSYGQTCGPNTHNDNNIYTGVQDAHVIGGGDTAALISDNKVYVKGKNYYLPLASMGISAPTVFAHNANLQDNSTRLPAGTPIDTQDATSIKLPTMFKIAASVTTDRVKGSDTQNGWSFNSSLSASAIIKFGEKRYLIDEGAVHYEPLQDSELKTSNSLQETAGNYIGNFGLATSVTGKTFTQLDDVDLYDATGDVLADAARRQMFALGNGYGYLIDEDGVLYAFGNNAAGQYGAGIPAGDDAKKGGSTLQQLSVDGFGNAKAVAAGLTQSKYYNGLADAVSVATFDDDTNKITVSNKSEGETYVDGDDYLTGVLTDTGLWVWNKNTAATNLMAAEESKFAPFGVTASGANSIATVVSGYGNNLFAISTLGKMFRIRYENNDFTVTMYDRFITDSAVDSNTPTANYTYANEAAKLYFDASNASSVKDPNARLDNSKPNGLADPQGAVLSLTEITPKIPVSETMRSYCADSSENYVPIISNDLTRDAFRILANEQDLTGYTDGTRGTYLADGISTPVNKAGRMVRFYRNTVADENELFVGGQLDWYLTYKVVAQGKNLVIEIYPYRATQPNEKIIMTYWVGCYDTVEKFADSKEKPVFYDIFEQSVEITIANTKAVGGQIAPYVSGKNYDANALSNSSIPLLDPNYELNRYYSIAVNDVSTGLAELTKKLEGTSAFTDAVIAAISDLKTGDLGFPAKTKSTDEGMRHLYSQSYLNTYFNDTYRYFVFDRDGDTVSRTAENALTTAGRGCFAVTDQTVTVRITLNSAMSALGGDDADEQTRRDAWEKAIDDFNNVYGLKLILEDDVLTISYDVVTITANVSTDTATYYNDDQSADNILHNVGTTADVSGFDYAGMFTFEEFIGGSEVGTIVENVNGSDTTQLPLHAQASMRTTTNVSSGGRITLTPTLTVGDANRGSYRCVLNDSELLKFTDTSHLYFTNAYTDLQTETTTYEAYEQYNNKFDADVCTVDLKKDSLTFTPKQADTYRFSVALRRDSRRQKNNILPFSNDEEIIYIDFVITASPSAFVNNPTSIIKNSFGTSRTLTTSATINVTDMTDLRDVKIISVSSSDRSKLTARLSNDGSSFTLSPSASGRVRITYVLEQYGVGYSGYMTVQVESRSTLDDTLSIVEREAVNFSELRSKILQDNSATEGIDDFSAWELDTFTAEERPDESFKSKGWYFIDPSTNAVITENNGLPIFVSAVDPVQNAQREITAFNISIGNYNSADDQMPSAIFVVCFKATNSVGVEKRFEGAVYVQPTTRFLKNPDATVGGDLVMQIDMKAASGEGWTLDSAGKVNITLDYLKGLPCLRGLINLENCRIQMVTTTEEAGKYFTYEHTENSLSISPDMPVSENIPINVSISDPASNTAYVLTFYVTIDGIVITLEKTQYVTILLSTLGGVFALLLIIFVIRMGVYWRKKAEQKRIIKKNQMLIRMRDKVHNTAAAATREQIVKTKLKLEDPKYAKMFNQMRKDKEEESGIALDNSVLAQKVDNKLEAGKKAKKKKGKKSINDLKAELEAKKEAFRQMQSGENVVMDTPVFEQPVFDQASFEQQPAFDATAFEGMQQGAPDTADMKMDSGDILFDVEQVDDNN